MIHKTEDVFLCIIALDNALPIWYLIITKDK